jgi:hypothetical protein
LGSKFLDILKGFRKISDFDIKEEIFHNGFNFIKETSAFYKNGRKTFILVDIKVTKEVQNFERRISHTEISRLFSGVRNIFDVYNLRCLNSKNGKE